LFRAWEGSPSARACPLAAKRGDFLGTATHFVFYLILFFFVIFYCSFLFFSSMINHPSSPSIVPQIFKLKASTQGPPIVSYPIKPWDRSRSDKGYLPNCTPQKILNVWVFQRVPIIMSLILCVLLFIYPPIFRSTFLPLF